MKTVHGVTIKIKKHYSEEYFCLEMSNEFEALNLAMTLSELEQLRNILTSKIEKEKEKCCVSDMQ